jgi:hypothetical protein
MSVHYYNELINYSGLKMIRVPIHSFCAFKFLLHFHILLIGYIFVSLPLIKNIKYIITGITQAIHTYCASILW